MSTTPSQWMISRSCIISNENYAICNKGREQRVLPLTFYLGLIGKNAFVICSLLIVCIRTCYLSLGFTIRFLGFFSLCFFFWSLPVHSIIIDSLFFCILFQISSFYRYLFWYQSMNWISRKIYLYNVTFGLYMLDWWERYLFSILSYLLVLFCSLYDWCSWIWSKDLNRLGNVRFSALLL